MAQTMAEAVIKVTEHDELLHDNVLPRLKEVERLQAEITKEMTAMRASQTNLELTVMKESQITRQQVDKLEGTMIAQNDSFMEVVKSAMGISSTRTTQLHEFKMAKWNHVSNILIKFGGGLTLILGSGTGVYMIIEHFFGK